MNMRYKLWTACMLLMLFILSGCSQESGVKSDTVVSKIQESTAPAKDPAAELEQTPEPTSAATLEPSATSAPKPVVTVSPTAEPEKVTLAFAGDILLADDAMPMKTYRQRGKGISGIFSDELIKEMREADIMMLNNEFAFSKRGKAAADKSYTFRAKPEDVSIFNDMGVDIVSLANNHALDFGTDALLDTFDTLKEAGIDYGGAGADYERASEIIYKKVGDKTISYVMAAKTIFAADWVATKSRPGMISCWDEALMKERIKTAGDNSDYTVVFVHWGVEQSESPEQYQRDWARMYVDAGADIVLGCHSHVIQGIEYYKGKPVVYSLGNFWFSSYKRESMMIKVEIDAQGNAETWLVPCMTGNFKTEILEKPSDRKQYFNKVRKLSKSTRIGEDGKLSPLKE